MEITYLSFHLLGGLALFLLGMSIMTSGLQAAAGEQLRALLGRGTRNRSAGLALGTTLGFLAHSSAATVMTVGFLNAGLLKLTQSLPVFFGANIGTTLSMQLISFRLTDLAFVAVTIGFIVQMVTPHTIVKNCGRALLGFGLLFWGMMTMSDVLEPYRETLATYLTAVDGTSWTGLFYGLLLATLITGLVQSSGAIIGICFALAAAGVFTNLEQVFPIVLGAHLGTSVTSLVASIGGNRDARRGALGNLAFNIVNVVIALLLAPLFLWGIPLLTGDLVHQIAHLHTAVMVLGAMALLPFIPFVVKLLHKIIPTEKTESEASYLDYGLIPFPEKSIHAVLQELGRSLELSMESLSCVRALAQKENRAKLRRIHRNEETINELKTAVYYFLTSLTRRYLSRRQMLMVQYLTHISNDVERVGDHVKHLAEIVALQRKRSEASFDNDLLRQHLTMIDDAGKVLEVTRASCSGEMQHDFKVAANRILTARNDYNRKSEELQKFLNDCVARHQVTSLVGLFFSDMSLTLDRMVRHCRMIAREQKQPFFSVKADKLDRVEPLVKEKPYPRKILDGEAHREITDLE